MRFHVLGIPHTITSIDYLSCAFTQKVLKFCAMMYTRNKEFEFEGGDEEGNIKKMLLLTVSSTQHHIIHYGHQRSDVICDEHVTVTDDKVLEKAYGKYDFKKEFFKHNTSDYANKVFTENTIREIEKRVLDGDVILCFWGSGHKIIADKFKDRCLIVEPGIGYNHASSFAPFKVYESYAVMHDHYGARKIINPPWYDTVIPNYWNPSDFKYNDKKGDYFLYLGRIIKVKGLEIILYLAEKMGFRLLIAGQGDITKDIGVPPDKIPKNVEIVGYADLEKRKELLSNAKALILPTYYIEPFGGVTIEAGMSGTPVITTDWGCFSETVLHGITGFRCRTLDHFEYAINHIDEIKPKNCYDWTTKNYSLEKVKEMYEEYFDMLKKVKFGRGFYQEYPQRNNLNWLNKVFPTN